MKNVDNVVKQLLNLDYVYEHVYASQFVGGKAVSTPTGYVLYKADELLPILETLEKEVNGTN